MYEELVKRLKDKAERFNYDGWVDTAIVLEQAADAIEELSKQNEKWEEALKTTLDFIPCWIPVTERVPKDEKNVLVYYGFLHDGVMTERRFVGVIEYYAFDVVPHWQHESTGLCVTHWMPLPEPPKEET